MLRREIIAVYS